MQQDGKLTERQRRVLAYFRDTVRDTGTPPTVRQVMRKCGLSPRGAQLQLRALVLRGHLLHEPLKKPAYRPLRSSARAVPILGRAPAGHPSDEPEDHRGEIHLPWRVGERAFAIRVDGESMRDAHVLDGDIAVVDPHVTSDDGDIVLAELNGKSTLKRLRIHDGRWWLEPANPAFTNQGPSVEGDRVVGRVVAVVRSLGGRVA